jgi:hypothetical protein
MTDERPETTDFERVLRALHDAGVEFILVGGLAAVVWGASRFTRDIDLVYRRTPENLRRLADALAPFAPYPRDAPPNLPFQWNATTLHRRTVSEICLEVAGIPPATAYFIAGEQRCFPKQPYGVR